MYISQKVHILIISNILRVVSQIEDILYEAEKLGLRDALFIEVGRIKNNNTSKSLEDIYEEAYSNVTSSLK